MLSSTNDIEEFQASLLRTLASPQRLRIVHLLGTRTREVNELAAELGITQPAVSQHLAAMRNVGLVEATRDGRSVRYRLSDPQILAACDLMREVLMRRLTALADLAATAWYEPANDSARSDSARSDSARSDTWRSNAVLAGASPAATPNG